MTEGIPFLGFIVDPYRRRLKRRKGVHYRRKLRRMVRLHEAGKLDIAEIEASVQGWGNHARYANTTGLRKAVLESMGFTEIVDRQESAECLYSSSPSLPRA